MMTSPTEDSYSAEEAHRRFEIALRAALNMPHKPHKVGAGKRRVSKQQPAAEGTPQPEREKGQP
jgi:hypothetical protein